MHGMEISEASMHWFELVLHIQVFLIMKENISIMCRVVWFFIFINKVEAIEAQKIKLKILLGQHCTCMTLHYCQTSGCLNFFIFIDLHFMQFVNNA